MNIQEFRRLNMEQRLKATLCSVEATSFEEHSLWDKWSNQSKNSYSSAVAWEQLSDGWLPTVGRINDKPVCISLSWNFIDGQPVLFWDATSILVDYDMIHDWLKKMMPQVYVDQVCLTTDAGNFHIIVHKIADINKQEGQP